MFVTCSRKSDLVVKKFAKYFTRYFPKLDFIPRSKTNLEKLFNKSFYIGYNYFLIFSKVKFSEDIILNIYKKSDDFKSYLLYKNYVFKNINLIKDFNNSFLEKIKNDLYIKDGLFDFLELDLIDDSNYIGYLKGNKFKFEYNEKELNFSFDIKM